MSKTYEQWVEDEDPYFGEESTRDAWDYQQSRIDYLEGVCESQQASNESLAKIIEELEALAAEVVESERLNRGTTRKPVYKRMPRHKRFESAVDKLREALATKPDTK